MPEGCKSLDEEVPTSIHPWQGGMAIGDISFNSEWNGASPVLAGVQCAI